MAESGLAEVLEARPKRRTDVMIRSVEGEVLVLDRRKEKIHQLNVTAAYIWERCDGRHSVVEIAMGLAAKFDIDLGTVSGHVAGAVREFEGLGLLEAPVVSGT